MLRTYLVLSLFFLFNLGACGGGDGPGEPCQPTGVGAGRCESGVCLTVRCASEVLHLCSGRSCDGQCSSGQVCVTTASLGGVCLPADSCGGGVPPEL